LLHKQIFDDGIEVRVINLLPKIVLIYRCLAVFLHCLLHKLVHLLKLILELLHAWCGWQLLHCSFQVPKALGHVDKQVQLFEFANSDQLKSFVLHFLFEANGLQVEPDPHFLEVLLLLQLGFPQSDAQHFVESGLALQLAFLFCGEQALELLAHLVR
jgi:hypothetical protein